MGQERTRRGGTLIVSVVISLLLGAVCTVLVAWMAALGAPYAHFPDSKSEVVLANSLSGSWTANIWSDPFGRRLRTQYAPQDGLAPINPWWSGGPYPDQPEVDSSQVEPDFRRLMRFEQYIEEQRGWPFVALRGGFATQTVRDGTREAVPHDSVIIQFGGSSIVSLTRLVPLSPVWPGFLLDTFCFAALIGGVGALAGSSHTWRERLKAAVGWLASWRLAVLVAAGAFVTLLTSWASSIVVTSPQEWVAAFGVPTIGAAPAGRHYDWYCSLYFSPGGTRMCSELTLSPPDQFVRTEPPFAALLPSPSSLARHSAETTLTDQVPHTTRLEVMAGYPLLALRGHVDRRVAATASALPVSVSRTTGLAQTPPADVAADQATGCLVLASHSGASFEDQRVLPLVPIWQGFMINTLIYSAAIGLLIGLLKLYKHERRRRGGCCTHCGYKLDPATPLARCPECGNRCQARVAPISVTKR